MMVRWFAKIANGFLAANYFLKKIHHTVPDTSQNRSLQRGNRNIKIKTLVKIQFVFYIFLSLDRRKPPHLKKSEYN